MTEHRVTLETLQAENYGAESWLDSKDKKIIRKMFRYIKSYHLSGYEVELVRKDILGMAAEAEKRGESIDTVIGHNYRKFCDELAEALGILDVPKGRKYLKIAGVYYYIIGWYGCITIILGMMLGIYFFFYQNGGSKNDDMILISFVSAILMVRAGKCAQACCMDRSKAIRCMRWGIVMLLVTVIKYAAPILMAAHDGSATGILPGEPAFLVYWLMILFDFFWVYIYLRGAARNRHTD